MRDVATRCLTAQEYRVPPRGVERTQETPGKTANPKEGGTECGTSDAKTSDLAAMVESLSAADRAKLAAMLKGE